ncbi:MAG: hypothetical protein NC120_09520 [Ruminococcus sp.]|nr:hypothetical protein [Ruminococcus sp.]
MHGENGNTFFRFLLTLSFLTGGIAYLFALVCGNTAAESVCFGILLIFSLLSAAGISVIDESLTKWLRTSTKTAILLFSFSFNGGALAAEILLIKGSELAALICVAAACAVSVVCAAILINRYSEDDM